MNKASAKPNKPRGYLPLDLEMNRDNRSILPQVRVDKLGERLNSQDQMLRKRYQGFSVSDELLFVPAFPVSVLIIIISSDKVQTRRR